MAPPLAFICQFCETRAKAHNKTVRKEGADREVMIVGKDTVMVRKRYDRLGEDVNVGAARQPGTPRLKRSRLWSSQPRS